MLAQVLPGFREIRGPLASGFLWLLLAYLIFHGDVQHAHGKVKEIEALGVKLSPAALAVAGSFTAYLVGSLSDDLFTGALKLVFDGLTPSSRYASVDSRLANFEDLDESFRERQIGRLENSEDRLSGESDLRIAILPPLVALIAYLAISERPLWWLGMVFVAGLGLQVWLRASDLFVVRSSLFGIRREAGVPPASVAEAKVEPKPDVKLWLLDHARKGKKYIVLTTWPTGVADEWADEASSFLRENASADEAASFIGLSSDNERQLVEQQVRTLEAIAAGY